MRASAHMEEKSKRKSGERGEGIEEGGSKISLGEGGEVGVQLHPILKLSDGAVLLSMEYGVQVDGRVAPGIAGSHHLVHRFSLH